MISNRERASDDLFGWTLNVLFFTTSLKHTDNKTTNLMLVQFLFQVSFQSQYLIFGSNIFPYNLFNWAIIIFYTFFSAIRLNGVFFVPIIFFLRKKGEISTTKQQTLAYKRVTWIFFWFFSPAHINTHVYIKFMYFALPCFALFVREM